jgi:nifR3 family TIM-barrel protein
MTDSNSEFLRQKVILAPMMMGSNRTFRRIALSFGADVLGGEMAYATKVAKENRGELARISARLEQGCFSAQICGRNIDALVRAAQIIEGRGASILDLNAGCPMHYAIQRGNGAALLESPGRLARLVEALKKSVNIPVTVKIRAGFYADKPRAAYLAKIVEEAGADGLAIHARSREQYYDTPADWSHIQKAKEAVVHMPIVGNGDIRTFEDALRMQEETKCDSVMIGRAALQRPWIFQEIKEKRPINLSPKERWAFMENHFGMIEEEFSPKFALELLAWHAGWYLRWHAEQRTLRSKWDQILAAAFEKKRDLVAIENTRRNLLEEIQNLTLTGPEILPQANLTYNQIEAG